MNQIVLLTSFFSLILFLMQGQPSGAASIQERDTDTVSQLQEKLQTLQKLLSEMDSDEDDLKQVAEEQDGDDDKEKKSVVSEDMLARTQVVDKNNKIRNKFARGGTMSDPKGSLQILSKALARLRQPTYNTEDSTGESMATQNNEEEDDKDTEEMATFIQGALAKLKQDRTPQMPDHAFERPLTSAHGRENYIKEGAFGDFVDTDDDTYSQRRKTSDRNNQLREEAIHAVVSRLLEDIKLANRLGISVDDLIAHLQSKEIQDAQIRMLDRELSLLEDAYKK